MTSNEETWVVSHVARLEARIDALEARIDALEHKAKAHEVEKIAKQEMLKEMVALPVIEPGRLPKSDYRWSQGPVAFGEREDGTPVLTATDAKPPSAWQLKAFAALQEKHKTEMENK